MWMAKNMAILLVECTVLFDIFREDSLRSEF
jgi:hypothetical protein